MFIARGNRGFTLIELLIVIAIIGILSATVLVSLNTARVKARTVAVKTQVLEMRKLMALEYSETGSYTNLTKGWAGVGAPCDSVGFAGSHAAQMVEICEVILANGGSSGNMLLLRVNTSLGYSNAEHFAIMAKLPDGSLFCAGSSGAVSDQVPHSGAGYLEPGCYSNP